YTENPASSDAGFFLLCVSQTRAATGHRQGLYPKNPHLTMRVFSLLLFVSHPRKTPSIPPIVIPAQAGIQWLRFMVFATEQTLVGSRTNRRHSHGIPALGGMTRGDAAVRRMALRSPAAVATNAAP